MPTQAASSAGLGASLQIWTFALSALVIVSAMASVIYFTLTKRSQTRAQYRVVIVLLFFALSCATSLVFSTKESSLKGDFWGFTVTVVGPAALWLIGLFAFFRFLPEEQVFPNPAEDPQSLGAITKSIVEVEARQGWNLYSNWKGELRGGFSDLFDKHETSTLKSLLHTTYFTHEREKLNEPRISSMWVYFESAVIKLQRIRGRKEGRAAWIRFGSNPTADTAHAGSVFLVGDTTEHKDIAVALGFTENDTVQYRGLQEVDYEPVDCLIMTLYDDSEYEDYLLVDIKRFSQSNSGTVEVAIASFDREIKRTSLWTLKQPFFTPEGEVPLALKKTLASPQVGTRALVIELTPWLTAVDKLLSAKAPGGKKRVSEGVINALTRIRAAAKNGAHIPEEEMSFVRLLSATDIAPSSWSYVIPGASNVTMLLVRMIDS